MADQGAAGVLYQIFPPALHGMPVAESRARVSFMSASGMEEEKAMAQLLRRGHEVADLHSGQLCRFRGYMFRRFDHLLPTGFVAVDTILNHG